MTRFQNKKKDAIESLKNPVSRNANAGGPVRANSAIMRGNRNNNSISGVASYCITTD